MSDLLQSALDLAAQGIPVFPCQDDKAPSCAGGFYAATTDPAEIRRLFANPRASLIGVPTGAASGIDALDLDPRNGSDTWAAQHKLPLTLTHRTRSGGQHYLFRHEEGLRCSTGQIAAGVDVKADGGYVIWWPTEIPWDTEPWPSRLLAEALAVSRARRDASNGTGEPGPSTADVVSLLDAMPNPSETGRDTYIGVALASAGAAVGLDLAAIGEAWIRWAERWPLSDGTARAKWESDFSRQTVTVGWQQLLGRASRLGADTSRWVGREFDGIPAPRKSRLLSIADIETMPDPEWLIDGWIPEKSLVEPFGPPKSGKSFIVLSMALHVAAGMPWFGHQVKGGGVVYIAGEGAGGYKSRIVSARQEYGIGADIPFWLVPTAVNLGDPAQVACLEADIRATAGDKRIRLVIFDTLARSIPGLDENSASELGRVIAVMDRIKQNLGCTVMPVHHSGKDSDRGPRGSNAGDGAVDTSLQISRPRPDLVVLACRYQKDGKEADPITFSMKPVGDSLVPVIAARTIASAVPKLSPTEQRMAGILDAMGGTAPIVDWVQACVDQGISLAENAVKVVQVLARGMANKRAVEINTGIVTRNVGNKMEMTDSRQETPGNKPETKWKRDRGNVETPETHSYRSVSVSRSLTAADTAALLQ